MTGELVSCIVPVHNGAAYLGEALDSIVAQTHRPLELIVVDDGSTDASAEIAAGHPGGVRLLRQANAGPAAARNRGVREARGDYLAFLDADDLWLPEKLARQLARFRQRAGLGFCVTLIQNFWTPGLAPGRDAGPGPSPDDPRPGYVAPTLVVRAETMAAVGEFCPARAHTSEPDWFLRAAERGVAGELVAEVLVRRRLHAANRSRLRSASSADEYLRLIKARLDRTRPARPDPAGRS